MIYISGICFSLFIYNITLVISGTYFLSNYQNVKEDCEHSWLLLAGNTSVFFFGVITNIINFSRFYLLYVFYIISLISMVGLNSYYISGNFNSCLNNHNDFNNFYIADNILLVVSLIVNIICYRRNYCTKKHGDTYELLISPFEKN